jgi:hypothetical protein
LVFKVAKLKDLHKWGEKKRTKIKSDIEIEREKREEKKEKEREKRREEKRKKEEKRREEKKRKEEEKERERERRKGSAEGQTQDGENGKDADRHDKKKKKKRSHHHSSSQRDGTQRASHHTQSQRDGSTRHKKDKKSRDQHRSQRSATQRTATQMAVDEGEDHLSYNNHDSVLHHDFSGYANLSSVRFANLVNGGANGTQMNTQNRRRRSSGKGASDMEDFKLFPGSKNVGNSSTLIDLSTPPAPGRGRNGSTNTANMTEEERKKYEKEKAERIAREKEKEKKKNKEIERNRRKLMQSRQCAPGSLNNIPVSKTDGKSDRKKEGRGDRQASQRNNGGGGLFQQGSSGRNTNSTQTGNAFFSGSSVLDQHRNSAFSFFPGMETQKGDANLNMNNGNADSINNSNMNAVNQNQRLLGLEILNNLANPNAIPTSLQEQQQQQLRNVLNSDFAANASSNIKYGKSNDANNDAIANANAKYGLQFSQLLKSLSEKSKQAGGSLNIRELLDPAILDSLDPGLVEALQLALQQADTVRSAVFSGGGGNGGFNGGLSANGGLNGGPNGNVCHGAFGMGLQQLNQQFANNQFGNQFQQFLDPNQLPELGASTFGQNTKPPVDQYLDRSQNLVPNPYFPKGCPPPLIQHEIGCQAEIEGVPVHFKFGKIMEPQMEVMSTILRACGEKVRSN